MSDLTYRYALASAIEKNKDADSVFLSKFSEIQKENAPCFFWGKLNQPFITAKCLITLSAVVQSSFNLSTPILRDPIVTTGNEMIRFEGFSHCAGVYAKVDILPNGHDGEMLATDTTNVDFNPPMIAALGSFNKRSKVTLSVGKESVGVHYEGKNVIEKKVPLPEKWIKGLTSVQIYFADTELRHEFNTIQAIQLFRSIPKGKPKTDFYLIKRGNKALFSPVKTKNAICIGGIQRLRLIEQLVPLCDKMIVFAHPDMQSTTWQLYFGDIRFCLSISRENWRGFSGEGAALEALIEDIPDTLISNYDKLAYANHTFNPTLLAVETGLDLNKVNNLSAQLSAIGLLGYDLDDNAFFYRRLPFGLSRIMNLNPRLKGVEKLLENNKVQIISQEDGKVGARVEGSGVHHTVLLEGDKARCTCTWFSRHKGERGFCKHILATKKLIS